MRPLQKQGDVLSAPTGGHRKVPLIPRRPEIMPYRLADERHLHAACIRVCCVIRAEIPEMIVQREHPRCLRADRVAIALGFQNAGQLNGVRQIFGRPVFREPGIGTIKGKPPWPVQRQRGGGGSGWPGQSRQEQSQNEQGRADHGLVWFRNATPYRITAAG